MKNLGIYLFIFISISVVFSSKARAQNMLSEKDYNKFVSDWQLQAQELGKSNIVEKVTICRGKKTRISLKKGTSLVFVHLDYEFARTYYPDPHTLEFALEILSVGEARIELIGEDSDIFVPGDPVRGDTQWKYIYTCPWRKGYWRLYRITANEKGQYLFTPSPTVR